LFILFVSSSIKLHSSHTTPSYAVDRWQKRVRYFPLIASFLYLLPPSFFFFLIRHKPKSPVIADQRVDGKQVPDVPSIPRLLTTPITPQITRVEFEHFQSVQNELAAQIAANSEAVAECLNQTKVLMDSLRELTTALAQSTQTTKTSLDQIAELIPTIATNVEASIGPNSQFALKFEQSLADFVERTEQKYQEQIQQLHVYYQNKPLTHPKRTWFYMTALRPPHNQGAEN